MITKSRNKREGHYAGRRQRYLIIAHWDNFGKMPKTRHYRTGMGAYEFSFKLSDMFS